MTNELLLEGEFYRLHRGDTIPIMASLPADSIDFAVTSPPFPAVYAYTDEASDIGNSEERPDAKLHLSFFFRQFRRILKPGRAFVMHCNQIPRMKRSGGEGLFDFRGLLIRLGERAGLVFEYDWAVRRNPQAQAITTKARELQFAGLESDRARQRGALPDYLLKFRAPGDNAVPVVGDGQVSRNDWIEWAECTWDAIKYPTSVMGDHKAFTLNAEIGRTDKETRHICPMQLSVIDRLVRLYTNPGEIVFDPFSGIGSTGYVSLRLGRRFVGCELKPEYQEASLAKFAETVAGLDAAEASMFDFMVEDEAVPEMTWVAS